MSDPYYLRKANIDELDLSKYEKDFTPEELAQTKEALKLAQQQHQQEFDKLPVSQRAKYHAADVADYVEQNPETFLAVPAAAALVGAGKAVANRSATAINQVHGSLRDFIKSKRGDDGLLANQQAEKAASQQPEMTAKEISANATPTTGVDVEANVGKAPSQADKIIIEQGVGNTERKAAEKQVTSAQKELAEGISKGLPPPDLTTGSGMPAYRGAAPEGTRLSTNIPSLDKVPSNMVFVPEGQYMDIVRNATGQQAFTDNLKATGGYPATPNAAYAQSRDINKSLGRASRSEALAAGSDLGDVTKSITKKVGAGKAIKVAGVSGALISFADLANAKDAARNVGEAMLPIGMTPSEVQSGKLPALELRERNEQFILNQPGNRAELEKKIKGKTPEEVNKIRQEYLASAPTSDFDRASRFFREQAAAKQGVPPPSMR